MRTQDKADPLKKTLLLDLCFGFRHNPKVWAKAYRLLQGSEEQPRRGPAAAAPNRGCRHVESGYQVNPEDGSVWCFSCQPPRQVS